MSDSLLGSIIGERYLLTHVVGQGGMGIVYRAEDVRLNGRPCAVKLLTGHSADPEEGKRFERELHIISRLHSQHVVQVLDAGSLPDRRRYIVMELLEGLPLSDLLKHGGALSTSRAINVIKGILAGLSEAHEHGVVHRDLKPANVFITRARTGAEVAKVLDFGIAKDTRQKREADLTAASMLIGTPKYMAPEQFLKQPADGRTDLYAAGLLLYQMLTGQPPFLASMPVPETIGTMPPEFRIGWMHINQLPMPLQLPPGLWEVIDCLLAKQPDARFADADAAIEALVAIEHSGRVPEPLPQLEGSGVRVQAAEDKSGTTGFPVMGEQLVAVEVEAPKQGKGLLAVASVLVAALVGGGAWFALREPPQPSAAAAKAGLCADEIRSEPDGAAVRQGPNALGFTPMTVERPCHEVWMIDVERAGYETAHLKLRSREANEAIFVKLEAVAARAPASAPPSAPTTEPPAAPATESAKPKPAPAKRAVHAPAKRTPRRAKRTPRPAAKARPSAKPAKAPTTKAPATQAPPKDETLFF